MAVSITDLGVVFNRAAALRAGVPPYTLRREVEKGRLERVARGVYRSAPTLEDGEPWEVLRSEHLRRCQALHAMHPGHVVSHQSAAVIHGLQFRLHPSMDVHLTSVERAPCSRRKDGVQLHHADSVVNDSTVVESIPVTTLARTIADVLRTSRLPHSVPVLDAAVRDGLVTARDVSAVLSTQRRWRGRPRALSALRLHDPLRESWLESFSFVTMHEFGVPIPRAQVDVLNEGFHLVGRVDGLLGTVFLEADGASKYYLLSQELGIAPEESLELTLAAQDERHRRLVELGMIGVRWTTAEMQQHPGTVVRRVNAALQRADPRTFRGWLRVGTKILRPEQLAQFDDLNSL